VSRAKIFPLSVAGSNRAARPMAANYKLTFARSARKELEKIPVSTTERIVERVTALPQNPRPPGAIK
jgi:hypothetical protein